jgi:hypothetical protein
LTTFYDPDGRVTGSSVVVRESEWCPSEVAVLLASRRLDVRGPHGHLLEESTSPLADPGNVAGTYFYRSGPAPRMDYAEKARRDAADVYRKALPDGATMNGMYFPVVRVDRPVA